MLRKKLYFIIFLVILGFVLPNLIYAQQQGTKEKCFVQDVSPKEAYKLIQKYFKAGKLIILDVRTKSEFRSGHIKGAINIDYYSEDFEKLLNKMDKSKPFLVYCRSGVRSLRATNIMEGLGFKKIYNLEGGILNWEDEGLPVVKGK